MSDLALIPVGTHMDEGPAEHEDPVGSDWYGLAEVWLGSPSHDTQLKLTFYALECQTFLHYPYISQKVEVKYPCLLEVPYVRSP